MSTSVVGLPFAFTVRQCQTMDLLIEVGTNKAIARRMGVATKTVEVQLQRCYDKMRAYGIDLRGGNVRTLATIAWMDRLKRETRFKWRIKPLPTPNPT